jgi:serine/threonine-protein kinase
VSAAEASASGFPRLDKYELLEEIGHGGMATVYRARDPRLGREVAVKVIHKHLRENAEVATRFVAEARAAAKLKHPGIVEVFDVSAEDDPERYLVVELIRGTTLRKVLQKHRDMPAEVGAAIVLTICEALEHAHAASIVHRDIKPENVLVELPTDRVAISSKRGEGQARAAAPARSAGDAPVGLSGGSYRAAPVERSEPATAIAGEIGDTQASTAEVVTPRGLKNKGDKEPKPGPRPARVPDLGVVIKITDFGIAKLLDAQGVTSTGQVLGSPAHMAPEQIEGGDVDARTDVFALGVLMYECLVGHLPFEGKNPAQVLRRVLEGEYAAADRERPAVGGRWARILAGALARDPTERTASAGVLGEQIEAELRVLGIADPRAEVTAYFADPPGYIDDHVARLVPRLVARGEGARKTGDVPGAAADFNRALALAPNDLAVLRRLASLTSSAGRRLLVRRAAAILAGSAVLGILTFGIARAMKDRPVHRDPLPPASGSAEHSPPPLDATGAVAVVAERPPQPPLSSAAPDPSGKRIPRVPATPIVVLPTTPPAPGVRNVRFEITPKGGSLTLDGSQRQWFGAVFSLPVGRHAVVVTIKGRCCRELSTSALVEPPPPAKLDDVQTIFLSMPIEPATVGLAGAPQNGQLSCPDLGLSVFAGGSSQVKLRDATWTTSCTFAAPDKKAKKGAVTLKAGEANMVPWPTE